MPECLNILCRKLGVLDAVCLSWGIIYLLNRLISILPLLCPMRIFLGHFRVFFSQWEHLEGWSLACVNLVDLRLGYSLWHNFLLLKDTRHFFFIYRQLACVCWAVLDWLCTGKTASSHCNLLIILARIHPVAYSMVELFCSLLPFLHRGLSGCQEILCLIEETTVITNNGTQTF